MSLNFIPKVILANLEVEKEVEPKEHRNIPTIKGKFEGTARDLLAKDIRDLRNYTNTPNSAIEELVRLNKKMYPKSFEKL